MATYSLNEVADRRYVALVDLAESLVAASDHAQVAACIAHTFAAGRGAAAPVRLWALAADGSQEVARLPELHAFPPRSARELRLAGSSKDPFRTADGFLLVGLPSPAASIGVIEIDDQEGDIDVELVRHSAAIVAFRFSLLVANGEGNLVLPAPPYDAEVADVIGKFAAEAKVVLEHDRLSAYLVSPDGRAVERFAVATSSIIPGEGGVVPFSDFGLRHILVTNRPLVSEDLATDARIVGREDRVIAQAGFHGLISVPLRLGGQPFGVLNFVSKTAGFYSDQDAAVAQQLADQVSVFFDHLHRQRDRRAWTRHEVAERERARLARDLHDTLARLVPEMTRTAAELAERVVGVDHAAASDARRLAEQAALVLADVRRALVNLVPPALDSHSLTEVLESEVSSFNEGGGARATLTLDGDASNLPAAVQRAVYRVLQEALANVRTHARAAGVRVGLTVGEGLSLSIDDDGVGFDHEHAKAAGLGLRFMADRASGLGGRLVLAGGPGQGTSVVLELPEVRQLSDRVDDEGAGSTGDRQQTGISLRVLLIEPRALLRAGLIQLLGSSADIRVVGAADSVDDAHRDIARLRPDLVVVDMDEEELSEGTVRMIRRSSPTTAVVAISDFEHDQAARILEIGTAGIIAKSLAADQLVRAIREAARGREVSRATRLEALRPMQSLTARERAVLALLAAGQTNTEIGKSLFLATKTIERHVAVTVSKLGARNRAHAVALAVSRGVVKMPHDE